MALPVDFIIFPPQNFVPASEDVPVNEDAALTGLSIFAYLDATAVTTTLSVSHGKLTVAPMSGTQVVGSDTNSVTLTGSAKQINATLSAANNVIYHGSQDFSGTDTLTVTTNDHFAWPVGPLSDTDQMSIHVDTPLIGASGDDNFTAPNGNARIDAGAGIDTITFNFKLTDATISFAGNEVIVDGPNGASHTVLTGFEVFKFTDGTVNNNDADPLINDLFYYSQWHDVWNAHADADLHYHVYGWKEGRDPNPYFDTNGYLAHYADVKAAGIDPLVHYDQVGWKEGRDPSVNFDTKHYLAAYPDVAAAHVDPLTHFLQYGLAEGRSAFGDGHWG